LKVRKAVILAAGYGTRFLPATKAVPKEMLPVLDTPVIQHIVDEAVAAGLDQIIIVTSASKRAIEDHFDRDFELEHVLEANQKLALLEAVRRPAATDIAFVRQKQRLGNGHAVLITRPFVGDEPFAIFFPDDLIFHTVPAIRQLLDAFAEHKRTVLAVQRVPRQEISQYGIIDPEAIGPRLHRVKGVIEKPPVSEAPSDLATVGRFVATPDVFDVLAQTPPGRAGEIWLMDAFDRMARSGTVYAYEYEGERFDTGRPIGLLQASLRAALQNPELAQALRGYIRALGM